MIKLPIITPSMEIGVINLSKQSVHPHDRNHISFECSSRVECCSTLDVPVTSYDVTRIQNAGYELDQIVANLSPIILPSKMSSASTEKVYKLKKKPFDGTCTFLINNLCTIHENKPFACKTYPFSLEIVDEHTIKVLVHSEKLCQSITAVDALSSNVTDILHEMLQHIATEMMERGILP